ncbi:MAG: helix-turn-helix transcriptional regulator [Burkholderiales bacterium]|nr:helix-turn-helix transcriptional regulator [Burkholderiales bacterium]
MPAAIQDARHKAIAALLVQLRKERGWLQHDLAHRLRRTQTFVSKYETGLRRLDAIELLDILRALDADPHEFIDQVMALPKSGAKR